MFFAVFLFAVVDVPVFSQEGRPPYMLGEEETPTVPIAPFPREEAIPPAMPAMKEEPPPSPKTIAPVQEAPAPPKREEIAPPSETAVEDGGALSSSGTDSGTDYELKMAAGTNYLSQGKHKEARLAFDEALRMRPNDTQTIYMLGVSEAKTGKFDEAEEKFYQVFKENPKQAGIALDLGIVHYNQKRYDKAIEFLNLAETQDPRNPIIYFYQGRVYQDTESYDWAATRFLKAAARAERRKPALAALSHYQAGVSLYRQEIFDEARNEFVKVLQREPKSEIGKSSQVFIKQINQMGTLGPKMEHAVSLAYQYDDNVVLEPSDVSFAGAISQKGDGRFVFHLSGDYPFGRPIPNTMGLGYSLYNSWHQELDRFNTVNYAANLYFLHKEDDQKFRFDYLLDYVNIDNSPYLKSHLLRPTLTLPANPDKTMELTYQLQMLKFIASKDYPSNSDRSGVSHRLGVVEHRFVQERKGALRYGYSLEIKNADNAEHDFHGHRLDSGVMYNFPWLLKGDLNAEVVVKRYHHPSSSLPNSKRADNMYTLGMGISRPLSKIFDASVKLTHRKNSSNDPIFDYQKTITSINVTGRF